MFRRAFACASLLSLSLFCASVYLSTRPRAWRSFPDVSRVIWHRRYGFRVEQDATEWRLVILRPLTARPDLISDPQIRAWVEQLRNDDLYWARGTPLARCMPPEALRKCANRAYPLLLKSLDDPGKFAAAHILLFCAGGWGHTDQQWESKPGERYYGGLRYTARADATASYDATQIPELKDFWSGVLVEPMCEIVLPRSGWFAVLPLVYLAIVCIRLHARRRLLRAGYCQTCGYDLRASSHRCPECGAPITV